MPHSVRKRLATYGVNRDSVCYDPEKHGSEEDPVMELVQTVNGFLATPDEGFKKALKSFEKFERTSDMNAEEFCLEFAKRLEQVQRYSPEQDRIFGDNYLGLEFLAKLRLPTEWKTFLF